MYTSCIAGSHIWYIIYMYMYMYLHNLLKLPLNLFLFFCCNSVYRRQWYIVYISTIQPTYICKLMYTYISSLHIYTSCDGLSSYSSRSTLSGLPRLSTKNNRLQSFDLPMKNNLSLNCSLLYAYKCKCLKKRIQALY